MPSTVAVLVPPLQPLKQSHTTLPPIAQALQTSSPPHILTVFGNKLYLKNNTVWINGYTLNNNTFTEINTQIDIIHDRFPSQSRHQQYLDFQEIACSIPFGNPVNTTLLCRDKYACQRFLESHGCTLPEVIEIPELFHEHLQQWGAGFLKPRFGSLGVGVQYVKPGSILPATLPSVVPNRTDPSILQRAIQAPKNWAGLCVRQLMQKDLGGHWLPRTPVLRRSRENEVVNVARGAQAIPASEALSTDTIASILRQSFDVCKAFDQLENGIYNVEFGLDFVIDGQEQPWLIEVNSRPRGRLEYLAERYPSKYQKEYHDTCIQPIVYLASLCG